MRFRYSLIKYIEKTNIPYETVTIDCGTREIFNMLIIILK